MRALEITYKEVERLDEVQLTILLKLLLHLEAKKYEILTSSVDVPLNIHVSDGGKDGSIEWESGPERTSFVPNRCTYYQCKATDMPKAKCKQELLVKTRKGHPKSLKPALNELFDKNGNYILFYNKSTTEEGDLGRVSEMRLALKEAGRTDHETSGIFIYNSEKIADWANE